MSTAAAVVDDGKQQRRKPSCLAKTFFAAVDGGICGAAIGSLMATGPAMANGLFNGGLRHIMRSGMASAVSVGGFMATFNGGVCSLEKARAKRDVVNPFLVGFGIGVAGAVPGYVQPLPNAPWAYRNPRALIGGGVGSAMLCSFFWMLSHSGGERLPAEPASDASGAGAVQPTVAPPVPLPAQAQDGLAQVVPVEALPVETPVLSDGLAQMPAAASFEQPPPPAPTADGTEARGATSEHITDPWAAK